MKKKIIIVGLLSLIFLSGCWDKVEIDQRIFVSTIGVDLHEESGMKKYMVTYEYPNINAIGKNATEDQKAYVHSTPASSIFQAASELSTQVPFPFYYKHLRVLILGEKLLNEEKMVRQVIDELNRDTKVNKNIQILAAEGKVSDIINANVIRAQTTDGVLYSTVKNNRTSGKYTAQTLTGLISALDFAGATVIPKVTVEGDRYSVSGGCLLKNYKHVAWLDEKENRGISFVNGKVVNETLDAFYKGDIISFTVIQVSSNKEVNLDKGIDVTFFVRLEGYLQGYIMGKDKTAFDMKVIEEMEKVLEEDVKKEIQSIIKKIQKTYKADVIGIGEHLSKFEPKKWREIKDDWDNIFPDINIDVSVDVKIRRIGLIK